MQIRYPSKWIKAEDIGDEAVVTIRNVDYEDSDDKGVSYFIKFDEFPDKKWTMNITNFKTISKVLGSDDSDDWIGKKITLYTTEVTFGGETMLGVRVRLKAPAAAQGQAVAKVMSSGPFGEKGELWVIAQVAKASAENPEATLDSLRTSLAGKHPEHEAVIHTEPRNWPKSIYKSVEEWVEEAKIPF